MLTERQQKLVDWLKKRKVATMKHMRHQFQLSHMTVVRALKKYGYFTSYNHNAAYYSPHDVPRFDRWGLWAYRDIRFSKFGTLTKTVVALVQNAPAGMTTAELQERLQTQVANLVCRLVQEGRLIQKALTRRQVVYLAANLARADRQYQRRTPAGSHAAPGCPPGLRSGGRRLQAGCRCDQDVATHRDRPVGTSASPRNRPPTN